MTIGQRIREQRRKAELTQEQLAELLSVSPQAVSRWETDAAMPDISLLLPLCNLFGVSADYLLGLERQAVLDISGRPYLVFDCAWRNERVGGLDLCMIREFFYAFSYSAGVTLHMTLLYGENDHHKAEALFKSFARALRTASGLRTGGVLSTKGILC